MQDNAPDTPEIPGMEDLADALRKKPKGMPSLAMVKDEAVRLGLTEEDASYMIDVWLQNGFRTKSGPVRDWRAAMRVWYRNCWFPSQKKANDGRGYRPSDPQQAALDRIKRAKGGH